MELSYEIAVAAGRDAGNRNAKAAGRTVWNEDDWNVAAAEFDRIRSIGWKVTQDHAEHGEG